MGSSLRSWFFSSPKSNTNCQSRTQIAKVKYKLPKSKILANCCLSAAVSVPVTHSQSHIQIAKVKRKLPKSNANCQSQMQIAKVKCKLPKSNANCQSQMQIAKVKDISKLLPITYTLPKSNTNCQSQMQIAKVKDITEWRRLIRCLKLQVIFRKRATNYRALLRKET